MRLNKYGARSTKFQDRTYHSNFEATIAQELNIRLKAGEIKEWKPQHKFRLHSNGKHITTYICDFKVVEADDTVVYIEAKGMLTELARVKMKLLEAQLPEDEPNAQFWIYWNSGKRERKV